MKIESGQIKVGTGTKLDYETKSSYMVTVTATDSFGLSDSVDVIITVTDVNEGPTITGATGEYRREWDGFCGDVHWGGSRERGRGYLVVVIC